MSLLSILAPEVSGVVKVVSTVVDRLVPDKNAAQRLKDEIEIEASQALIKGELGQLEINKAEAASSSMFVSGWRPFIGWICGGALAYQYLLTPLAWWVATSFQLPMTAPPKLDDVLWQLMFGMLGMGTLRTVEKFKGVSK